MKKINKKLILILGVLVLSLALLVAAFSFGMKTATNNAQKKIDNANAEAEEWKTKYVELSEVPVVLDAVTPEIVEKVLNDGLSEISELATTEYIFTNAAKFTDTAHITKALDWATKKSFIQKWNGTIKAGVDISDLQVTILNNVITITMPQAKILSYEVDYDSVEILDEKNNLFNPIDVDDKVNFDKETSAEMKERAIKSGLLEKAEANAKMVLENILATAIANIEDYEIQFVVIPN